MPDNSNPYLTVGQPNYAAPLVNFAGDINSGMRAGQNARGIANKMFGGNQPQQGQPQWPHAGQYQFPQGQNPTQQQMQMGQANPGQPPMQSQKQGPQYAQNLAHLFGIGLPNQQGQQGQQPGAQSPTQWGGNPSPYTNFDFPGT